MKKVLLALLISATAITAAAVAFTKALPDYLFDPECWFNQD